MMSLFTKNRKKLRKHQQKTRDMWLSSSDSMHKELDKVRSMSKDELDRYLNGVFISEGINCAYFGAGLVEYELI